MSDAATTAGTSLSLDTARRAALALLLLLGIAAIIMPEHLPALVASPLAGSDAIAAAINGGIDWFVAVFKPALRAVAGGLDWAVRGLQKILHATRSDLQTNLPLAASRFRPRAERVPCGVFSRRASPH